MVGFSLGKARNIDSSLSSIDREIKDIEIPRVAGCLASILGIERFREQHRDHFFVPTAMRTEASGQQAEVVVFRIPAKHDVSP